MKRVLVIVVLFSFVLAACGGGSDVVASVNGVDIERSRVEMLIPPEELQLGTYEFTRYLSVTIQWEAVNQGAKSDFGVDPTEPEVDARLNEFVAGLEDGRTLEEYLGDVAATEVGIREFARQLVVQDAIERHLADALVPISDDVISGQLLNDVRSWTVVCASHILVGTIEEADAVEARLDAGESFASLASEVSLDLETAPQGGNLGCGSPAAYLEPFATAVMEAEIEVVTAPIKSVSGYHMILVSQREVATPDTVRETLHRAALVAALEEWFVAIVAEADVTVDEAIGVWVREPTPQVLATH